MKFGHQKRFAGIPKPLAAILAAISMLLGVEFAVQVRAYLRTGQSMLTRLVEQGAYAYDSRTGLRLLRPNNAFGGNVQEIRSNSHGLRNAEVEVPRPKGRRRIAVLGASTAMGAYSARNELTFPALLEAELKHRMPGYGVEVINAGVVGLTLAQQRQLFERLVVGYEPDLVVIYPGFNDFAGYCRAKPAANRIQPKPIWTVQLPPWLLSVDLALKNTVALRTVPDGAAIVVDAGKLDLGPYERALAELIESITSRGPQVVIVTNARSYRPDQPLEQQLALSETARFFNSCFDLRGLHLLYDRHNESIVRIARQHDIAVWRLDEAIPGGRKHFADASHFSEAGERFTAAWLADRLLESPQLLARRP